MIAVVFLTELASIGMVLMGAHQDVVRCAADAALPAVFESAPGMEYRQTKMGTEITEGMGN